MTITATGDSPEEAVESPTPSRKRSSALRRKSARRKIHNVVAAIFRQLEGGPSARTSPNTSNRGGIPVEVEERLEAGDAEKSVEQLHASHVSGVAEAGCRNGIIGRSSA